MSKATILHQYFDLFNNGLDDSEGVLQLHNTGQDVALRSRLRVDWVLRSLERNSTITESEFEHHKGGRKPPFYSSSKGLRADLDGVNAACFRDRSSFILIKLQKNSRSEERGWGQTPK